jgi:hypothetical protein
MPDTAVSDTVLRWFATLILVVSSLVATGYATAAERELPRLHVSENRRFLVTAPGKPFFWLGDTAWELFHRLSREETERYLANRAAMGFNVIQAVALAELDGLTVPNPQGHLPLVVEPFLRPAVVEGPENDYWDDMEWTLRLAGRKGLYVGLLPMWGKYCPSDTGNCERYGRFIGERFKDHTNIIWILGGDRPAPSKREQDAWRAMAKGIAIGVSGREDYDRVLMTYHTFGPDVSSKYFHEDAWLDFNGIQSSHGNAILNWKMIESHPFLTQAPDQSLLVNGGGDDLDHLAALRGDGYALIYTPTGIPFRIRLDKLKGKEVRAWWFDPRTGKFSDAGQFAKQGERAFTPPGNPGVGNDWVLRLEAVHPPDPKT